MIKPFPNQKHKYVLLNNATPFFLFCQIIPRNTVRNKLFLTLRKPLTIIYMLTYKMEYNQIILPIIICMFAILL